MQTRWVVQYRKPSAVGAFERWLDTQSQAGWAFAGGGRLLCRLTRQTGAPVAHRVCYTTARPGSAADLTECGALELAGWTQARRHGGWRLMTRPADSPMPAPPDRSAIRALYSARAARWSTVRMWMLVLAAVLLVGGYAVDLLPVLYGSVLPLTVALIATLCIKQYEEEIT